MDLIPLDYDALAPQGQAPPVAPPPVAPVAPVEDRLTRVTRPEPAPVAPPLPPPEPPPPEPEQPKADYTVPPAPVLPTVALAGEAKPRLTKAELIPLDYDAFAPKKEADSWADPRSYAALRGGAEGLQAIKGGKDFLTVLDLSFGGKSDDEKKKIILEQPPETAPTGWERREPSIAGVGSVGEFGTWLQESAGSAVTSTMPSVIGGMAGGIGGTALAGPVGGLVGAAGGAALPSMALGLSGMYQDMRSNEGVRAALQNGTITVDQFQKLTLVGGLMTGALDSIPAAHWSGKALGLDVAKKAIRDTLIKAAIKGGFEEGGTEALQQVVSEAGQSGGGGNTTLGQQAINVLDAGLQGLVGGMVFGAATREKKPLVANEGEENPPKVDDTPDVATPVLPEGTPAAVTQPPEVSTPGGLSSGPQPPPVGTEKQPDSPVITTPAPAVGDPRTLAKPPLPAVTAPAAAGVEVVTPSAPASDINAALTGAPVTQANEQQHPEAFDLRQTLPEEATPQEVETATREHEARIRDMFRDEHALQKRQEQLADVTKVAPANTDIAAALAPVAQVPQPQTPQPQAVMQETLGTGRALNPLPAATGPAITAQPPQPPAAAPAVGTPPAPPIPSVTVGGVSAQPAPTDVAAFTAALPQSTGVPVSQEAAPPPVLPTPPATVEATVAPGQPAAPEAPVVQPQAPRVLAAPAAVEEAPARAAPTKLSRDAASHALGHPDLYDTMLSHLPGFRPTVDEVAAQVVAERRAARPGESMGQVIRGSEADIVARVKERMAPAEQQAETQREVAAKSEEARSAATIKEERKAKTEEKVKAQAAETKGQKKERTGKEKGKSATGIRGESPKATLGAIKEDLTKPEAERDPLLAAWLHVHQQQNRLAKNPKAENKAAVEAQRAKFEEQKQQIQELRAAKAGEAVEAREGLSPERAATRDQLRTVLGNHPTPGTTGSSVSIRALTDHLKAFRAAVKASGAKLADHIDRVHQSMEENLAIFARKISTRDDAEYTPHDFATAQLFMDNGADGDFYTLITNEKQEGSSYNEQIGGADDVQSEASRVREDTSLTSGVHKHAISGQTPLWDQPGEEDALARSGRFATRARAASRQARDEAARKPARDITVTRPSDGRKVTVRAETRKGSDVLREVNRGLQADQPRGFISTIRSALVRHLTALVGDIDVHYVSAADMAGLHSHDFEPAGLYYNYSAAQRANGARPQVFILDELALHPGEHAHTVLHELTHAATSLALTRDIRGTAKIVGSMMRSLSSQLSSQQRQQFEHAFTNPSEFVAEAFSNPHFQELLGAIQMPADIRRQVSGVSSNRTPTWWDGVVSMVSNSIGMLWGQRGQSYMSQVTRLFPEIAYSQQGQRAMAREAMALPALHADLTGALPAAMDEQALNLNWRQIGDAAKSRYENALTPRGRRMRDIFATSGEHIRRSVGLFGGENNPLERKIRSSLLERDTLRSTYREKIEGEAGQPDIESKKLQLAQMEFSHKNQREWNEIEGFLHESSRLEIDPTEALFQGPNDHVNKTGPLHQQLRTRHAALEKEFAKFSPEGQRVARQTIEHYRAADTQKSRRLIRHGIDNALRYGASLPAGKNVNDAIDWIMSGDAARDATTQTQADKDFHAALGNTGKTLADVPFLKKIKGIYVPFMRRGAYFITATERPFGTLANPKNLPAGAVMDAENRLLFKKEADANAFAGSHPGKVRMQIKWVDPLTGKATTKMAQYVNPATGQLVTPRATYVATVQTKRMEMSDNQSYLKGRAQALRDQGHDASDVGISRSELENAARELQTPEVSRLINSLKQTTPGANTVSQQAVAAAINDAHLRSMTNAGALERGMKRNNVLGEDLDLIKSTRDYNRDMAHHFANLELAPRMAQDDTDVTNYINAQRRTDKIGSGLTIARQGQNAEIDKRILGYQGDSSDGKLAHIMSVVHNITFLRHLASPHFTIMQLVQPYTTTLPVLQSKYGIAGASKEIGRAYKLGFKTTRKGFSELGKAATNVGRTARESLNYDQYWKNEVIRGEPDEAQLRDVIDEVARLGFGAASGVESGGISELDMNWTEKALNRSVNVAKAMPEWAEGINRYVTAIATYRLEMLEHGDHARAVRQAALTVEETQGSYGAANNPNFFRHPLMKPATQFKKYSIAYGQLYWKQVAYSVGKDPAKRKVAIKALLGLSATLVSLAGVGGLPLVEPLRMVVNILAAAGLKDDDWDKDESDLQKGLAALIKWAGGSTSLSDALAEAGVHGFTRLANVDTSNTFGADNLALFGQPKTFSDEGVWAWLGKAGAGASGSLLFDTGKALINGDLKGAVPYPKIVDNVIKAYTLKTKGTVSKKTGEQYHEPYKLYEAGVKAIGLRPAEESRPFEGGRASQAKQLSQTNDERRTLMARWRNADSSEKSRIYNEEVRAWNDSHANPDDKIHKPDLVKSIRSKKASDKRLARAAEYED